MLSETVSDALLKKGLIAALAITGGISLILWLMPSMLLDFRSSFDAQYQLPDWYYNALLMDLGFGGCVALFGLYLIRGGFVVLVLYLERSEKGGDIRRDRCCGLDVG